MQITAARIANNRNYPFYNNKKIFLLNPVPTDEKFDFIREEIEACRPIILDGNLDLIE